MAKRKRTSFQQFAGSVQASGASRDSSVSQPADNEGARILLVDAGWVKDRIAQQLVRDQRQPIHLNDILETTEQFNAGCIVGTDFPRQVLAVQGDFVALNKECLRSKETTWHVWYDPDMWSVSEFELSYLGADRSPSAQEALGKRQCAILSLRYHDGTQIRLMVMKILKGTAAAVDILQLNSVKREEIMECAFDFLSRPNTGAKMVVGDLGVGLATLHNYMRLHDIDDGLQTHCNKSQTFHALLRAPGNTMTTTIDTGSERMMLLQTSTHCIFKSTLQTSGDSHPAAEADASPSNPSSGSGDLHPTVELKSWRTCQVEALEKITQVSAATLTDSDDAHLTVQLLYQPFIAKHQDAEGCWHNEPIDVKLSAHTFANALALLKKVRRDVGCEKDGATLSKDQFDSAWKLLRSIFVEHFMRSARLKAAEPESRHGGARKKYKGDVRGALQGW